MHDAPSPIRNFISQHYRHFNAATLKDAAQGYEDFLAKGNAMMVTLAGAMSTAELGLSLAEMIRAGKVDAITCTGANLEEDLYNLVAHDFYERVPHYRHLTGEEEEALCARGLNRVTDTCIPEEEAIRRIEGELIRLWKEADAEQRGHFPYEYLYRIIRDKSLSEHYQIDPKNSWLVAAAEKDLPIFTPGWEDSTCGNIFASYCLRGEIRHSTTVKMGIDAMMKLANWYQATTAGGTEVGFFQIGGGIAGDFPICVVPMLTQDMELENTKLWGYFCQISDSTTSYGSYSGAVPNEKITWGKLGKDTPSYIIESDATIVAPLIFGYLLGW